MKEYADRLIDKMVSDKLNYSEIIVVVQLMQERLKKVIKVKKKENEKQ